LIRLPFWWPHLQPTFGEPLDAGALATLHTEVDRAGAAQMAVALDNHYAARSQTFGMDIEYYPSGAVEDLWKRLSDEFKDDPSVIAYDLVNEPDVSTDAMWQAMSNSMVKTIRENGDQKIIWVEGNAYAGVDEFTDNGWTPWITDPNDHHVMDASDNIMYFRARVSELWWKFRRHDESYL